MKNAIICAIVSLMWVNLAIAKANPEDFAAAAKLGKPLVICKTKDEAQQCSATCKPLAPLALSVDVDLKEATVAKRIFKGENQIQDTNLRRCKVTDQDNWSCSNLDKDENYLESMSDGKYFYMMEIDQSSFYMCSK
jgi:mannose/fructose/N-acetylgalactosamine-specific phosphotransferase system component IIC